MGNYSKSPKTKRITDRTNYDCWEMRSRGDTIRPRAGKMLSRSDTIRSRADKIRRRAEKIRSRGDKKNRCQKNNRLLMVKL